MPNGISCAYFAGKNLIYGQKEKNVFKEGIAGIQTTRAIDSAAQAGILKIPHANTLTKITGTIKKCLYPLIILSGAYNTIKSEDKVKTGCQQASGIASMYAFEKVAEKGLNFIDKNLRSTNTVKNNKKLSASLYILKGISFVCASLAGYDLGSKIAGKSVDKIRNKNEIINSPDIETEKNNNENADKSSDSQKENTFEDFV